MNKFHLAYSKEIDKELFDTALERRNDLVPTTASYGSYYGSFWPE